MHSRSFESRLSPSRSLVSIVVLATLVSLVSASCGSSETADAPPSTVPASSTEEPAPPSTTTSSSQPVSEEEQILAAYQGYWDTWLAANDPPDPNHPDLERYYTGPSLERARQAIDDHLHLGLLIRRPPGSRWRHEATVVSITFDHATVSDCSVDDLWIVTAADGSVLNDAVQTTRSQGTLVRADGVWRVHDVIVLERWEGEAGCAV